MATVGRTAGITLSVCVEMKIDTGHVVMREDCYTAQCTIVTDEHQNQITAFHPGPWGWRTSTKSRRMPLSPWPSCHPIPK